MIARPYLCVSLTVALLAGSNSRTHAQAPPPRTGDAAAVVAPILAPAVAPTVAPATSPSTQPAHPVAPSTRPSIAAPAGSRADAGAPATSPAAEPATATASPPPLPVPDGAREAVTRLSSREERERRKAGDALVRMGPAVKPLLEALIHQSADLETMTRGRAALAQIEEDRLIGPSYVTLHVKDAEPRAVAAELSRQCYAELKVFPDNLWDDVPAKVTINVDREPFWVAMQQFTEQTGLSIQQYNDGFRLMRGGQQMTGPWAVRGAFLAVAQTMTRIQVVQLVAGQGPGQAAVAQAAPANGRGDFNLAMMAVAEPKLEVVRSNMQVRVTEAVDDNGNSLLFEGPDNRGFFGSQGRFWNLTARLNWPAKNPGKRITRLRATATFTIQTKVQHLEIQDPLHMKEHPEVVGGVPVTMRSLVKTGDNWELKFGVSTAALGGPGWLALQQTLMTKLQLLDTHGVPLEHRGMGSTGQQNQIDFNMQFAGGQLPNGTRTGDAAILVWEVPLETRDINVPIAFDDLPMPQ